jgi:hypothetical protein
MPVIFIYNIKLSMSRVKKISRVNDYLCEQITPLPFFDYCSYFCESSSCDCEVFVNSTNVLSSLFSRKGNDSRIIEGAVVSNKVINTSVLQNRAVNNTSSSSGTVTNGATTCGSSTNCATTCGATTNNINCENYDNDLCFINNIGLYGKHSAAIGEILLYEGNIPPNNYLLCDGDEISRSTYSLLFAAIGVRYGSGNNNSTFNLPLLEDLEYTGNCSKTIIYTHIIRAI